MLVSRNCFNLDSFSADNDSASDVAAAAAVLFDFGLVTWNVADTTLLFDQRAAAMLDRERLAGKVLPLSEWRRLGLQGRRPLMAAIRTLLGGTTTSSRVRLTLQRADGERRHLTAAFHRKRPESDTIVIALADETERRWAELEIAATLTTVPSAMIVIDQRGIIRAFSATAERMFGYRAADITGQLIDMLMPEPDQSNHAGYLSRYFETGDAKIIGRSRHVHGMRADGSVFPAELWVGEASFDGERLFTGFLTDQTGRLRTESKLQELQDDLIHATRLSAMGELSLALAHELNQPLAALVNHLNIASHFAEDVPHQSGERLRRSVANAANQALRAGQIVKRLRAFVERGEAEPGLEPAGRIAGEAVSLLANAAQRKAIQMQVALPGSGARVFADKVQVQQVLINLLRNAIEALERSRNKDRRLSVEVRVVPPDIEFSVEDNGPGISPEMEPELFSRFSTTERTGGMGVGLSISRRIVEAHGSELRYRRGDMGGARFSFRLRQVEDSDPK
jgi:two-component system, LuxR family, sensor kinase FixL